MTPDTRVVELFHALKISGHACFELLFAVRYFRENTVDERANSCLLQHSDVHCVYVEVHLLITLMLTLSTSVNMSTSPHMHTESTLTLDNLTSLLDGVVEDLDRVASWLHIPLSKHRELEQQYGWKQRPRAYSTYFITKHPSPSWILVANALWKSGELGALEVVQKLYLKGESCWESCRSE